MVLISKRGAYLFVFILILLPSVLGIEINLVRDNYFGKETFQAEIIGNFISLDEKNVLVYEEGKARPESGLSGLVKRGDKYYYYLVLPDKAGNFSLKIEDVQYIRSGRLIDDDIYVDFKINEIIGPVLSVNPGFIIADEDFFSINVMSYNGNLDVTATLEGSGEIKSVRLIDSLSEKLIFSVFGIDGIETRLNVGQYNIPVYLLKSQLIIIGEIVEIRIIPLDLIGKLNPEEDYTFELVLENNGNKNISNITLKSDLDVLIEPSFIDFLGMNEKKVVKVTMEKLGDVKNISGEIIVEFDGGNSILPISFEVGENDQVVVEVEGEDVAKEEDVDPNEIKDSLNCQSLGGEICLDERECNEETNPSLDGPCCLGQCVEKEGFNWWAIGLLILVLVGGIVGVYYIKIKKKQIPKSKEEILNDKTEKYKRRMKLTRGPQVNKELDRV